VALAAIAKTIFPAVYEVVRVTGWAAAASAGARYDVQVGGVSVLNGGPAAPGIGAADPAIPALLAARQGSVAQPLAVLASTEAAGLITDLCVVVTIRYRVHRGDVGMLT
jgi:hypothetical protein